MLRQTVPARAAIGYPLELCRARGGAGAPDAVAMAVAPTIMSRNRHIYKGTPVLPARCAGDRRDAEAVNQLQKSVAGTLMPMCDLFGSSEDMNRWVLRVMQDELHQRQHNPDLFFRDVHGSPLPPSGASADTDFARAA